MPTDMLIEARNVRIGRDEGMGATSSPHHRQQALQTHSGAWDTAGVFVAARDAAAFTQLDFASTVPFDYVATGAHWM